jgi:hypothetical protein
MDLTAVDESFRRDLGIAEQYETADLFLLCFDEIQRESNCIAIMLQRIQKGNLFQPGHARSGVRA